MIFVVLGMHKSGTTLLSQCLEASGIDMGEFDPTLDYGSGNNFERLETQELNRDLLHGLLIPPLDYLIRRWRVPERDALGYRRNRDSIAIIRYHAIARRRLDEDERKRMRNLIRDCESHSKDWGFKDPRSCLTYHLWREELPEHRLLIVFRGLPQLLQRYRATPLTPLRYFRVVHAWTVHNWMVLNHLRDRSIPALVVRYEQIMFNREALGKIEAFVGKTLTDVRKLELYRNKARTREDQFPDIPRGFRRWLPADPKAIFAQLQERQI